MEQFTIESYIWGHRVSKLSWTPAIGEMLSCKREPQNTIDPFSVAVTPDSFTVVGHVARRATSFQVHVAGHGYLTDHANSITKLTTPVIYTRGFSFNGLLPNHQSVKFNPPPKFPTTRFAQLLKDWCGTAFKCVYIGPSKQFTPAWCRGNAFTRSRHHVSFNVPLQQSLLSFWSPSN